MILGMGFSSVGVVGSGPVGCAIAIAIARTATPVTIVRAAHGDASLARRRIESRLRFFADAGEMTSRELEEAREGIRLADDLGALAGCDLVIESVSGDDRARRAILATLEARLSPGAVLATNSPPDRLREIGEVLRRRDQFVGLHFFQGSERASAARARPRLPSTQLVELGLLVETAPGVAAACKAFVSSIGSTTIERGAGSVVVEYREFLSGDGA
jgi:3-hydroxyacyl-CoA dehydrogenase